MIDDPEAVAVALQRAARELIDHDPVRDLEKTTAELVRVAVATVPGATAGGLSHLQDGQVHSEHSTDPVIAEINAVQTAHQQGPCITAAEEAPDDGIVHADDLAGRVDTDRWPSFAPQATALGIRSVLAIGLHTGRERHSALNLYAERPGVFDEAARLIASAFGTQATTLLYGAERAVGLDRALNSRDTIGQAKGILMERFGFDGDRAFRQLVTASQETNVKLTAVAEFVVGEVEDRARSARTSPPPTIERARAANRSGAANRTERERRGTDDAAARTS